MSTKEPTEPSPAKKQISHAARAEEMTAAEIRTHLAGLAPKDEFRIAPGVYIYRQTDGKPKPFVRLYYSPDKTDDKSPKHEYWTPESIEEAKELHAKCKREIKECRKNGVAWDPEKYKSRALIARQQADGLTVREWGEQWFESVIVTRHPPGTQDAYRASLTHHVYPYMGDRRLNAIKKHDCIELAAVIMAKPAPRGGGNLKFGTMIAVMGMLSACFSEAVDRELMPANPVPAPIKTKLINALRLPYTQTSFLGYSEEEETILLEGFLKYEPEYHPLILAAVRAGLREGELVALEPQHIDTQSRLITVAQTWNFGAIRPAKNRRIQEVEMSQELADVLEHHLARRHAEEQIRGIKFTYLFGWEADRPLSPRTLYGVFQSMIKFLGLRHVRFHDTRTTFGDRVYNETHDLVYVRDQMRHASISTTADKYLNKVNRKERHLVDRLDSTAFKASRSANTTPMEIAPTEPAISTTNTWPHAPTTLGATGIDMHKQVQDYEVQLIRHALEKTGGNRTAAAALLNIDRATLANKIPRVRRSLAKSSHEDTPRQDDAA